MSIVGDRKVNPWLVLVLVCLAQFMVILDATVVNVALPSIKAGLQFSTADLQWVVNAYTLTFGGFLLLGGRAADLFGRQRVFLIGLVVFSAASLFNGLAQSQGMLVAARALQGLGGALISPAALSIITTTFEEGPQRTKALGVWSAIAAGGAALGLLLGGVLTQAVNWRWIFFVNVPVGIAAFVLSMRFVPESRVEGQRGVDVGGAIAVTAGLMAMVYAIVKASTDGWGSSATLTFGAIAIVLLTTFFMIERSFRAPLVRLGIFRTRSLAMSNLAMFMAAGGLFSMFFFMTIYIQTVLGYKPLQAGFAFLPVTFGIGIGAGTAQQSIKQAGVRATTIVGMVLASGGFVLMGRIAIDSTYVGTVLPGLLLMSVGMGLTFVPITLIATTNVTSSDAGLASGLLNTSQQVGGALGLAILSTLAANRSTSFITDLGHVPSPVDQLSGLVQGFRLALDAGAGLLLAGAVVVVVFVRAHHVANVATGASPEPAAA